MTQTRQVEYGNPVSPPDEPTRTDYEFFGWYIDDKFTGEPFDFDTPIGGDLTLYAGWAILW